MIILGIDPGLATTGWGVITGNRNTMRIAEYGCITTSSGQLHAHRLYSIHCQLLKLIHKYRPDSVAVEELFFYKNVKTATKVGEARGVILVTAAMQQIKVVEYTPLQVKQAITGYGRADKQQIQRMLKSLFKLKKVPNPDDAADALAVALTCAQTRVL